MSIPSDPNHMTQIHISHLPPAMVDSHIERIKRAAFRAGTEARTNQIRELITGVVMRHLANITACELMAELDKTIDNLPLPEMTEKESHD